MEDRSRIFITNIPDNSVSIKIPDEKNVKLTHNDLSESLRKFWLLGEIVGLVPANGEFKKLISRKISLPAVLNALIACLLFGVSLTLIVSSFRTSIKSVNEFAEFNFYIVYYACAGFVCVYFRRSKTKIQEIFSDWKNSSIYFSEPDLHFRLEVNLVVWSVLAGALLENIGYYDYFHRIFSPKQEGIGNSPASSYHSWETSYIVTNPLWSNIVPFNIVSGIFADVFNKIAIFTFNYTDLIIVVFGRALYFKFKKLKELAEATLIGRNINNVDLWQQYVKDYQTLCSLVRKVNGFLSVLIFCSYGTNGFDLCNQVQFSLIRQPDPSIFRKLYNIWAFVHLMTRLYLVNESCARVHFWAHAATEVFSKCPRKIYDAADMERVERYANVNPVALTVGGCFIITKPLVLQTIGVIFTIVIVLLQATQLPMNYPHN